jgi:hypothetical protein
MQTISVKDNDAPLLLRTEADGDFDCDEVPRARENFARDNCDELVTVEFSTVVQTSDKCANDYTLINSWTASDRTGNVGAHSQTIIVTDNDAPIRLDEPTICIFPGSTKFAVFTDAQNSIFDVADNCAGPVTVVLVACNSTSAGSVAGNSAFNDPRCVLAPTGELLVKSGNDVTYDLYANLADACGNERKVAKHFWIPATPEAALAYPKSCTEATSAGVLQ